MRETHYSYLILANEYFLPKSQMVCCCTLTCFSGEHLKGLCHLSMLSLLSEQQVVKLTFVLLYSSTVEVNRI